MKDLGEQTVTRKRVRSIQNFQVTIGAAGDIIDVAAIVENRDPDTDELIDISSLEFPSYRFSDAEIRAVIGSSDESTSSDSETVNPIPELPDYDTLRIGLSKLMHALLDTRPNTN